MSIIADFHLHTDHSGDSKASMETQILAGIEKGLKIMCFTDHYDPDFPYENVPDVSPGTFELDYEPYREEYLEMRDRYKDRIELRFGIELGLQYAFIGFAIVIIGAIIKVRYYRCPHCGAVRAVRKCNLQFQAFNCPDCKKKVDFEPKA